jgi:hypothetical protein
MVEKFEKKFLGTWWVNITLYLSEFGYELKKYSFLNTKYTVQFIMAISFNLKAG